MIQLVEAIVLGFIPAFFMLFCTLVGLGTEVPHDIAGALQHFAAGILICSIGIELLPAMKNASGVSEVFASGVGFFSGVALMIVVGNLCPELEEDEDEEAEKKKEEAVDPPKDRGIPRNNSIAGRKTSMLSMAYNRSGSGSFENQFPISNISEETPLVDNVTSQNKPFPTALLVTVCVDSILDGLLIGISTAAGPSAATMLSLSLSVEMSFLGLTLATAMAGYPSKSSVPASFLGPAFIITGASIGSLISSALSSNPTALIGMLSFGVAALLFMVAEELLLQAHENGKHVWWVDVQLYVGFFVSILLGKLVPE
mmetsp:Transcript_24751/g.60813  ORF Transcript_24751/g.60813 Transcript_24751/m.60813 type:complete len:313 (+) Transcript_24751:242-1180(+)